jgi:hypothetical protein
MLNNKGFSNILVISLVVILLGVGGYFGYTYINKPNPPKINSQNVTPQTQPVQPVAPKTENDNLKYLKAAKINSDLGLSGQLAFKNDPKEGEDYYFNDKQELFLDYAATGAQAVAKLSNGKWVKVLSWNGYPDCKTFDNSGVPYQKSTFEYGCILDSKGQPLRASVNKTDSIEYCKFQFKRFGEYPFSGDINCKKLMQ